MLSVRYRLAAILNSVPVLIVVLLTTVYLLFANDVRLLSFTSSADRIFEILSSICFFFFLLECVIRCCVDTDLAYVNGARNTQNLSSTERAFDAAWRFVFCGQHRRLHLSGYAFSFMFCLDLISLVSILPEIQWIWGDLSVTTSSLSATRASRAARIGARLGRIVRVVRIVRIVRLWSTWWRTVEQQQDTSEELTKAETQLLRESRIGYHLTQSTTRTVIILVLLTLLLTPLFEWTPLEYGPLIAANLIHDANVHRFSGWHVAVHSIETQYAHQSALLGSSAFLQGDATQPFLVRAEFSPASGVDPVLIINHTDVYGSLRQGAWSELSTFYFSTVIANVTATTLISFNMRPLQRLESLLSIFLTLVIIILLMLGAFQFSASAQMLVLRPIERMLEFVERIATNPSTDTSQSRGEFEVTYETQLLENVIKKIVGILRVGFGAAGMQMIANHVSTRRKQLDASEELISELSGNSFSIARTADTIRAKRLSNRHAAPEHVSTSQLVFTPASGHDRPPFQPFSWRSQFIPGRRFDAGDAAGSGMFDPFRSGRQVRVIIAKVGIPHFSAVCELLGERALTYNNLVAKIVHDTVLAWDGAVLTNAGGQFTCAWVIDDAWEELMHDTRAHDFIRGRRSSSVQASSLRAQSVAFDEKSPQPLTPAQFTPISGLPPLARRQASLGAAIIGEEAPADDFESGTTPAEGDGDSSNPVHVLVRYISQSDLSLRSPSRSSPRRGGSAVGTPQLRRRSGAPRASLLLPRTSVVKASSTTQETLDVGNFDVSSSVIMAPFRGASNNAIDVPQSSAPYVPHSHDGVAADEVVGNNDNDVHSRAAAVLAEKAREVADKALASALKMIAAVRRSHDLNRSPELETLRASGRLRGLRPDLWIGMHAVSAVECAVGTGHKVNPALLCSEAATAHALQRLAPFYGAGVLLSGPVHALLSSSVQPLCRLVDELQSPTPTAVYAYDTWEWRAPPTTPFAGSQASAASDRSPPLPRLLPFSALGSAVITDADIFNIAHSGLLERERCISLLGEADIIEHPIRKAAFSAEVFDKDAEIVALRLERPQSFRRHAESAVRAYLQRDWAAARESFLAASQACRLTSAQPGSVNGPPAAHTTPEHLRFWLDPASLRILDAMPAIS